MTERRVLSVIDAAKALDTSTWSIYRMLRDGELHAVKIGRLTKIPIADIDRFLAGPAPEQAS